MRHPAVCVWCTFPLPLSLQESKPMNAARSVDPEACDRCGVQKATKHLEFTGSGPWNACVDCGQRLIVFHAKRRKAKPSPVVPLPSM